MEAQLPNSAQIHQYIGQFDKLLQKPKFKEFYKETFYQRAKQYQTKDRNLKKALKYYAKAACQGEKIESSIKDFASVLHQCGNTSQAVKFLEKFKSFVKGGEKYQNLLENLRKQINPSGKYTCKKILLTNIDIYLNKNDILNMFGNANRIQSISFSSYLDFRNQVRQTNYRKYCILTFDSFSAGKKTLETFNFQQLWGIDKYWTTIQDRVICEAQDGRTDFQKLKVQHDRIIYDHQNQLYLVKSLYSDSIKYEVTQNQFEMIKQVKAFKNLQEANSHAIFILKSTIGDMQNLIFQTKKLKKLKNKMI